MFVNCIDSLETFYHLKADWDSLYRSDPESQFFLSWKWLAGVLETYPNEWVILAVRTIDGELIGLLPLRRETVWSRSREQLRNEFAFAGRMFWADYGGILCHPDFEIMVLSALAYHLKQMNWSHLYFKGFHISDRRFAMFMGPFVDKELKIEFLDAFINDGKTNNLICPSVDLPKTFEEYLNQKLSSNSRQKARRLLRQLESSPEYRISATTEATQSRDLEILEKFWYDTWLPLKGSETRSLAVKYTKIIKRGWDDGLVYMPLLWRGENPLGILASFVDQEKSRLLFFVAGRDESFNELPVGSLLHYQNIRWAIENGLQTYDMLRGDEPYKYSLGAKDRKLRYVCIRRRSGTNRNGILDPAAVDEAIRLTEELANKGFVEKARTGCQQVLASHPAQESALRILNSLDNG